MTGFAVFFHVAHPARIAVLADIPGVHREQGSLLIRDFRLDLYELAEVLAQYHARAEGHVLWRVVLLQLLDPVPEWVLLGLADYAWRPRPSAEQAAGSRGLRAALFTMGHHLPSQGGPAWSRIAQMRYRTLIAGQGRHGSEQDKNRLPRRPAAGTPQHAAAIMKTGRTSPAASIAAGFVCSW
jgi:hypothetical protein